MLHISPPAGYFVHIFLHAATFIFLMCHLRENLIAMIDNYLRTALRQLMKYRGTVAINLLGLSFGLACCMMCFIHLRYQFSFDSFHENKNEIFRVITGDAVNSQSWVKMAAPIPPKLKNDVPEIESFCRFHSVSYSDRVAVESNGETFLESSFMMADPVFFNMFSYPLLKGSADDVLSDINSVVISETIARKLFGDIDPIGKTIRLKDNNLDFQVSGVMKDLPEITHLRCDYMVSFENLERLLGQGRSQAWNEFNYFAYVQLTKGSDVEEVQKKIQAIRIDLPGQEALAFGELRLQPLTDIHFEHNRGNLKPSYDPKYLYIFMALAVSVLVITIMNYFNLSTMLSLRRMREIGVRKSVGATTQQISSQLISENIATTMISFLLGLIFLEVLSPLAGFVLGYSFRISYTDPYFIGGFLLLAVLLGTFSGSYLAWFSARFKPGSILKGSASNRPVVQNVLIFVQFALSLGLIACSMVINKQMQFITNKDLGFDQAHVINLNLSRDLSVTQLNSLKEELRKLPEVEAVAMSNFTPGRANWHQSVWWEGQTEDVSMFIIPVDRDFLEAMKMELVEGTYDDLQTQEPMSYVINEAAKELIGWDKSQGRLVAAFGSETKRPVAAVVKDFNYTSLHQGIEPLVMVLYKEAQFSKLSVRLMPGSITSQIDHVKKSYEKVAGNLPFEFTFMDENIAELYHSERQMNGVVLMLTTVAVAFALLGIYALISFSIENRTKEIAIRKVLGISAADLLSLFSGTYLKIAIASAVVTIPVCWVMLGSWLGRFNYKIELSPLWFAASLLVVLAAITAIALLKYASMRQINPASSLKHE